MINREREDTGLSPELQLDNLVGAMNDELAKSLERWKFDRYSKDEMSHLNTVFGLADRAALEITLEIRKSAIEREAWDNFVRILPAELEIYGEEKVDSWLIKVQPASRETGPDAHVLFATDFGTPKLTFFHKNHGADGHFLPQDIISITIR